MSEENNILSDENADYLLKLILEGIETGQNKLVLRDDKDEH